MIKEKKSTTYVTSDGTEFTEKPKAEEHENALKDLKYFRVRQGTDCTEGRYQLKNSWLMAVNAKSNHELFAEAACELLFGNRVVFVQGFFGSNAISKNWVLSGAENEAGTGLIDYVVEDRFATKLIVASGINKRTDTGWERISRFK